MNRMSIRCTASGVAFYALVIASGTFAGPCDEPAVVARRAILNDYLQCETCADRLLADLAADPGLAECLEAVVIGADVAPEGPDRASLAAAFREILSRTNAAPGIAAMDLQTEARYVESDLDNLETLRRSRAAIALTRRPLNEVRPLLERVLEVLRKSPRSSDELIIELIEDRLSGE